MVKLQHRIPKIVFELDLPSEARARLVQERVSAFSKRRLPELLERSLDGCDTVAAVSAFERIELDLGRLSETDLEEELAERLVQRLRAALSGWSARAHSPPSHRPGAQAIAEVDFPPRNGDAAGGMGETARQTSERRVQDMGPDEFSPESERWPFLPAHFDPFIAAAMDESPEVRLQRLRTAGRSAAFRRRLVRQLPAARLREILDWLEPRHAGQIGRWLRELAGLLEPETCGLPSRLELSRMLWEFALAWLLGEPAGSFEARGFLASLLRQLHGRSGRGGSPGPAGRVRDLASMDAPGALSADLRQLLGSLAESTTAGENAILLVPPESSAAGRVGASRRQLEILVAFLERGLLPWPSKAGPGPDAILAALIREAPDELLYRIRRLGRREAVRKRLAYGFSEPSIRRLIRLMEPRDAGLIFAYVREVSATQQASPVVRQDHRSFRRSLWELVLTFLLFDRGSHFNARSFVKATLLRLAARYRVSYRQLLLGLLARMGSFTVAPSQKYTLPSILLSLGDEEQIGLVPAEFPNTASSVEPGQPYTDADLLAFWLTRGHPPAWSRTTDIAALESLLRRLASDHPHALAALFADLAREPGAPARLAGMLGSVTTRRVLGILATANGESIPEIVDLLDAARPPGIERADFRRTVHEFLFDALADGLRLEQWYPRLRDCLAARHGLAHPAVADFLAETLQAGPRAAALPPRWAQALANLAPEARDGEPGLAVQKGAPVPPGQVSPPTAPSSADVLERWLAQGIPPSMEWGIREVSGIQPQTPGHEQRGGGAFPSEAGRDATGSATWFDELADADLLSVLRRVGSREPVVRRLARQLPEGSRVRVVRMLAGTRAAVVLEFHGQLKTLAARADGVLPRAAVSHSAECLLGYLLSHAGRPWSAEDLVRRVLVALSVRHGRSIHRLLEAIAGAAGSELAAICHMLAAEVRVDSAFRTVDPARVRAEPTAVSGRPGALSLWLRFLETGALPPALDSPQQGFGQALAEDPAALLRELRAIGDRPQVVDRLVHHLPPAELGRLVGQLLPDLAGFVLSFVDLAGGLQTDPVLSPEQRRRASFVHWRTALAMLTEPDGPRFSAARFLADATRRIAQDLGLSPASYHERLLRLAYGQTGEIRFRSVADILEGVAAEYGESRPESPVPARDTEAEGGQPGLPNLEQTLPVPVADDGPELLRYFLQYGELPEAAGLATFEELVKRLERDLRLRPVDYRRLIQWAAGREPERGRLAGALPPPLFRRMLELLWPDQAEAVRCSLESLEQAAAVLSGGSAAHWRRIGVEEWLRMLHGRPQRPDFAAFWRAVLRRLGEERRIPAEQVHAVVHPLLERRGGRRLRPVVRALDAAARELTVLDAAAAFIKTAGGERLSRESSARELRRHPRVTVSNRDFLLVCDSSALGIPWKGGRIAGAAEAPSPTANAVASRPEQRGTNAEPFTPTSPPRTAWPYRRTENELPREDEPFYVENAGLVLLWPFLTRYFQMLDLLDKPAFRDADARSRAVCLLQFLATGEDDPPEPALLLNKILCGMETALPLEPQAPLSEAERALSEELLHGITRNWSKLRNTSIMGLREAFLQREGRLLRKDESWSLTVAPKAYDLLLDTLPWSLSTIRLAWMKQVLYVQWR